MQHSRIILFTCSLFLWLGVAFLGPIVQASEGTGGQVSTTGKISFYEEETEPSEPTTTQPSAATPINPSGKRLPSTGERIRTYCLIGGGIILLILLILFLRKRRKEEQE